MSTPGCLNWFGTFYIKSWGPGVQRPPAPRRRNPRASKPRKPRTNNISHVRSCSFSLCNLEQNVSKSCWRPRVQRPPATRLTKHHVFKPYKCKAAQTIAAQASAPKRNGAVAVPFSRNGAVPRKCRNYSSPKNNILACSSVCVVVCVCICLCA